MHTYIYIYIHGDSCMPNTDRYSCLSTNMHAYIHTYIQVIHFSLETYNFRVKYLCNFHICTFPDFHASGYMEV